jgi:hypothetical protein
MDEVEEFVALYGMGVAIDFVKTLPVCPEVLGCLARLYDRAEAEGISDAQMNDCVFHGRSMAVA